MKLLVIEDSDEKSRAIEALAREVERDAIVLIARSLASAYSLLESTKFDLIVIDFLIPATDYTPEEKKPLGKEILRLIENSARNKAAHIFALTEYPEYAEENETIFSAAGVIIATYDELNDSWKPTLRSFLNKVAATPRRRFVILCALEKERDAFFKTGANVSKPYSLNDLDTSDITVDGTAGCLILCPRMGLVNAAVVATLAIERFSPDFICMAGICAGFKDRTQLGQVIIADPCWEHQVGKVSPTGFEIEPYHINLDEPFRRDLLHFINNSLDLNALYADLELNQIPTEPASISSFVSGSSVVSTSEKITEIMKQHRKLSGLDMEAYGVMLAARLSSTHVKAMTAKCVVDYADEQKDDSFHKVSSIISARFVVSLLSHFLRQEA